MLCVRAIAKCKGSWAIQKSCSGFCQQQQLKHHPCTTSKPHLNESKSAIYSGYRISYQSGLAVIGTNPNWLKELKNSPRKLRTLKNKSCGLWNTNLLLNAIALSKWWLRDAQPPLWRN
ncbi:hypothetical protein F7734_10815 [Scytonema sp. UIC 10036]|uniref:hypothetical protein n=1 Tax=Scytonema sp. UIC 10036 TaxID=2304196 RepID=UPI0012DA7F9F|nr:hypothetical protein [Scytonema sp. UIC 10036]MUG92907.1 hypothetical protein [Scytonema sp. UIC 10036]